MHHQLSNTAVLVFIRDEREEARLKSFGAKRSVRTSLQVVRTLNQHVTKITRQSGLPTFIIKGSQQVGSNFGERFSNAIESIFESGYESVISIGNDCLSLTAGHLQTMTEKLKGGTALVLGPAKDGGAYAIGIQSDAFYKDEFLQLPWQTEQLFDGLVSYIKNLNRTWHCLPLAIDVDDAPSFQHAIAHLSTASRLYRLLKHILQTTRIQPIVDIPFISNHLSFIGLLRAPPATL